MTTEKIWGRFPSIKLFGTLRLLAVLTPLSLLFGRLIERRPLPLHLLIYLIGCGAIIYAFFSCWYLTVTSNDDGIRIRGLFKNQLIRWDDIRGYTVAEQLVCIDVDAMRPITIYTQYIKERDQFIELLHAKLDKAEETECLACGALISGASDHCPACGWSWQNNH